VEYDTATYTHIHIGRSLLKMASLAANILVVHFETMALLAANSESSPLGTFVILARFFACITFRSFVHFVVDLAVLYSLLVVRHLT
jgi:hypothetical protein